MRIYKALSVVPFLALMIACAEVTPATSDLETGGSLGFSEGTYEGGVADLSLAITVANGQASVEMARPGCIGQLEGQVSNGPSGVWFIDADDFGTQCRLTMTPSGGQSYQVEQGPGCSIYHGAACEFTGEITKTGN